jgi:hypothetical protein
LVWLMLVCALVVGWWTNQREYRALQDRATQMAIELEVAKEASKMEAIQLERLQELRQITTRH